MFSFVHWLNMASASTGDHTAPVVSQKIHMSLTRTERVFGKTQKGNEAYEMTRIFHGRESEVAVLPYSPA